MTRSQPIAGMTDAKPYPLIIVTDMRRDRTQPVMARVGSSDLHSYLGRWKFDFVVEDDEVSKVDTGVFKGFFDRAPRFVHESRGAEQDHPLMIERSFRGLALKTAAPGCETMTPRNFIDGHEADIVPVMRVLCTGIAEPNKESHDAASRARLLLLVATAGGRLGAGRRRRLCTCRGSRRTCRRRGGGRGRGAHRRGRRHRGGPR